MPLNDQIPDNIDSVISHAKFPVKMATIVIFIFYEVEQKHT